MTEPEMVRVVTCMLCGQSIQPGLHECAGGMARWITQADWDDAYPREFWEGLLADAGQPQEK